jgi:hypothetical protein
MFRNMKLTLASLMLFATLFVPVLTTVNVGAQGLPKDCGGIQGCLEDGTDKTDTSAGNTVDLPQLIQRAINIISWIVGVAAVIMIIIGGFKYIISGGDSNNVSGAKNTILYAIIGLVIVALAQIIVRFVLTNVTAT